MIFFKAFFSLKNIPFSGRKILKRMKTMKSLRLAELLKKLYSSSLIVCVKDFGGSSGVVVALDDDGDEGAEHDGGLEGVRPHHGLNSALFK